MRQVPRREGYHIDVTCPVLVCNLHREHAIYGNVISRSRDTCLIHAHFPQQLASPTGDRGNLAVPVPAPVVPYVPPTPGLYGVTPLPVAEESHLGYAYTTPEDEEQDEKVLLSYHDSDKAYIIY